jgi:GNAT superfamily N-acetyltransferase
VEGIGISENNSSNKIMQLKIKKATKDDFQTIQKLNFLLFKKEQKDFDNTLKINWPFTTEGEKYFQYLMESNNGQVWLALVDGEPVGYLAGKIKSDTPSSRKIKKRAVPDNMFVLADFRNRGIGGKLVKEFIKWTSLKKVDNIRVTAFAKNSSAINFYKKYGFQEYNLTLEINKSNNEE